MAAISVKKSISESMSACLLRGCGERMDNIRYKMLELLVYKHVIVHLQMPKDATSIFFFIWNTKSTENLVTSNLKLS